MITDHVRFQLPWSRALSWCIGGALLALLVALAVRDLSPFMLAVLVAGAAFLVLMTRMPWLAYAALVASVPAQEFGAVPFGGSLLTITRATFPLAILGLLIGLVIRREHVRLHVALLPFVVWLGVLTISGLSARDGTASAAEIGRWSVAFVSFLLGLHFLSGASERRILVFIGVLALGGVFEATFGVTQSLLALGPESFQVYTGVSRAFGTFGHPNSYAGYLIMVFFPVGWIGVYYLTRLPDALRRYRRSRLDGLLASRPERRRLLLCLALTVGLLASAGITIGGVLASYSRGAWLGVAAALVITAFLYSRFTRLIVVTLVPVTVILFLGGFSGVLPAKVGDRLSESSSQFRLFDPGSIPVTDANFAAVERMAHWQTGLEMFEDHPAIGVGAGNYNVRFEDYFVRQEFRFSRGHAHNYYIHALAETGILGLSAYLTLIGGFLLLGTWVVLQAPDGFARMLALGSLGAMIAVSMHNVFENLHVLNLGVQLSLIWALTVTAHRRWRTGQDLTDRLVN